MGPDLEPWNSELSGRKAGSEQKEELAFTNLGLDTTDL